MIEIQRQSLPYLSGISVLGVASSLSMLNSINEFCGFYQDEFTEKNEKNYVDYTRLVRGVSWLALSIFSGYGCNLVLGDFQVTNSTKIDPQLFASHEQALERFGVFYADRYREKNSLRNLCWNYLESDEALRVLRTGQGLGTTFEPIIKYAYESFNAIERETAELKRQLDYLSNDFSKSSAHLRNSLEHYEIGKGLKINLMRLCQTPFGWLDANLCSTPKKMIAQEKKYRIYEIEVEEYERDVFSYQRIQRCKKAYNIQEEFDEVYAYGEMRVEQENLSWGTWLMGFFGR